MKYPSNFKTKTDVGEIYQQASIAVQLGTASKNMRHFLAFMTVGALLFTAACSQSPEKLVSEANKYHDNKKFEEASILYEKAIAKDKTNAEAYYRLGMNLLDQGKLREARAALRRSVDLKKTTENQSALAALYLRVYQANPNSKTFVGELRDLGNDLLKQDPNSFQGLLIEGRIADLLDGDKAKAEESYAKANGIKKYAHDLIPVYADVLVRDNKRDQAVTLLTDATKYDPAWDLGYALLAQLYEGSKEPDKEKAVLQQYLDSNPNNRNAITVNALERLRANDFAGGEQLMMRMTKDPKTFPKGEMDLGTYYEKANRLDLAKAAYERGKNDDPKNAYQYDRKIIEVDLRTKDMKDAVSRAKQVAESNPKDPSSTVTYAFLLVTTSGADSSVANVDVIKKLVDAAPTNTTLRYWLAKAYVAAGDRIPKSHDLALTTVKQVVDDAQKDQQSKGVQMILPAAKVLEAELVLGNGDFAQALDLIQQSEQAFTQIDQGRAAGMLLRDPLFDPNILVMTSHVVKDAALLEKAEAAHRSGDESGVRAAMGQAQADLEFIAGKFPNLAEVHLNLASIYLREAQFDKALQQYQTVLAANPQNLIAEIGLQKTKMETGHAQEAIQTTQDLVSKNPTNVALRLALAQLMARAAGLSAANSPAQRQYLQQAEDNYKQVLTLSSANKEQVWWEIATLQEKLGEKDNAMASFEQVTNVDPKNAAAYMERGQLLETEGRQKEAIDLYKKVLDISPDNPLALNNMAMASADSGTNLDQAQSWAERAKKRMPDSADITDTLGYVYLKKNLTAEAADTFRSAIAFGMAEKPAPSASLPIFRFHLAMALLQKGDKQGAKEQATKAMQGATPDLQGKIKTLIGQIG